MTGWHKHMMEKHVLSDQTDFLSGQNLSLARQMPCSLTKIVCKLIIITVDKSEEYPSAFYKDFDIMFKQRNF